MFDVREEDDLFMLLFVLFVGVNEDGEEDTFELLAGEAIIDGLAARLLPRRFLSFRSSSSSALSRFTNTPWLAPIISST